MITDDSLCVCGHTAEDHHRSWFPGGAMWVSECEAYGHAQTGGCEFVDGKWVDHCHHFQLAA